MPDYVSCPMCEDGVAVRAEGRLEQSGDTWLPTTVWTCDRCGWAHYDAARDTHWRDDGPPVSPAPLRRAA